MPWFAVRHIVEFHRNPVAYEERITLWERVSADEAISAAEQEAAEYAGIYDDGYAVALGLFQSFELSEPPGDSQEVFSLIRESDLDSSKYLDAFFDTGRERQQHVSPQDG